MGVALLEAGLATSVLAVDQNETALAACARAASGLALRTERADLETCRWQPADTVLLIDVLYQLDPAVQQAVLARAAASARHCVLIRATDPAAGWRSTVSTVLERVGRGWWPTFGPRSHPIPPALLMAWLGAHGFDVGASPCADGTPLAGVLIVGVRRSP